MTLASEIPEYLKVCKILGLGNAKGVKDPGRMGRVYPLPIPNWIFAKKCYILVL